MHAILLLHLADLSPLNRFQPKCENCLFTPFDLASSDFHLEPCRTCSLAFFCSSSCRSEGIEEHKRDQCSQLKSISNMDRLKLNHLQISGETNIELPTQRPLRAYQPLKALQGWHDYFTSVGQIPNTSCVNQDLSPQDDSDKAQHMSALLSLAAESATSVLTILAGAEASIPDLKTREEITIHIVGATYYEFQTLRMNEEFLHLLPALQRLIVGYFGPDVPTKDAETGLVHQECCPDCTGNRRSREVFFKRGLYHDSNKSEITVQHPPDLLVALHPGFEEVESDSWRPTLDSILDSGMPTVFTTYNHQEAMLETKILDEMGAHVVRGMEKNKWSGKVPYQECFGSRYEFYYTNYFWYVIQGKT